MRCHLYSKRSALRLEKLEPRHLLSATIGSMPVAEIVPADNLVVFPIQRLPVDGDFVAKDDVGPWRPPTVAKLRLPEEGFGSEKALRDWLIESIDTEFGEFFGTSTGGFGNYPIFKHQPIVVEGIVSWTDIDLRQVANNAADFSNTNVQVEGVDEADLIETDGRFVYLVTGKELLIIDAEDPENLEIASRVELNEAPSGMYLFGDRLTLIAEENPAAGQSHSTRGLNRSHWISPDINSISSTTVTVLDLSDRTAPRQVQQTQLTGSLVSSRMVNGQLRLVLSEDVGTSNLMLPGLQRVNGGDAYESREAYLDRVVDDKIDLLLSTYRTYSASGQLLGEEYLVDPGELVNYPEHGQLYRTSIVTFDTSSEVAGPADSLTVYTERASEIYSTEESIYIFGLSQSGHWSNVATSIWKFDVDSENHSISESASGQVDGSLLNQFSVDEHDGYLRIVTSNSERTAGQSLQVLEQHGNRLEVVGSVHNIAPGENLYSVRFVEEVAYAVTFRVVDPLFTIDLSDPTNPQVTGELKIPGYSDYLQPIDDDHLLAIGRGANAWSGRFEELQISIFNVSDLDDPQLAHRYSFEGGRDVASIATGSQWQRGDVTHQAVSYFAAEEIVAIPVHDAGSFHWNAGALANAEGSLHVFSVDTETGFERLAIVEHETAILRSLRLGDALLAFSSGEISAHDLSNPSQQLDSLQLLVGSEIGLVELFDFSPRVWWIDVDQPLTETEELPSSHIEATTSSAPVDWFTHRSHRSADRVFGLIGQIETREPLDSNDMMEDELLAEKMNPNFGTAMRAAISNRR